ncbi:MAG: ferritin [Firmicutes bacterium]|nr:ferritin [Bacillota bacterium]
MPESTQRLFNHLIQVENVSAQLYLAMSSYFGKIGLSGMENWLRLQYKEERGHAEKLIDHVVDRDGTVRLLPIPEQPSSFGTPLDAFQNVLRHEQYVTEQYREAYGIVTRENDLESLPIILDFLREQVEEEAQADVIVDRLRISGSDPAAILLIDRELGQRGR